MPTPTNTPPGFLRRLGAMTYDTILLIAVLIMLSYPYVWLTGGDKPSFWVRTIYQIYLLSICFLFYAGPWIRGGQTLGMRSWRLKLERRDGGAITWPIAFKRFIFALLSFFLLGLGFLWILHDRDKLAWHDRWSGTRMILVPKQA
ncbi:MAG: RDD family protein [Gammaproteobacteria bacterium]|nr:RDD family protein [Gammaproteobacteria bacterium]